MQESFEAGRWQLEYALMGFCIVFSLVDAKLLSVQTKVPSMSWGVEA